MVVPLPISHTGMRMCKVMKRVITQNVGIPCFLPNLRSQWRISCLKTNIKQKQRLIQSDKCRSCLYMIVYLLPCFSLTGCTWKWLPKKQGRKSLWNAVQLCITTVQLCSWVILCSSGIYQVLGTKLKNLIVSKLLGGANIVFSNFSFKETEEVFKVKKSSYSKKIVKQLKKEYKEDLEKSKVRTEVNSPTDGNCKTNSNFCNSKGLSIVNTNGVFSRWILWLLREFSTSNWSRACIKLNVSIWTPQMLVWSW